MPISSLTSSLVQLPAAPRESRARTPVVEVVDVEERGTQRPVPGREAASASELDAAKPGVEIIDALVQQPLRSAQVFENSGNAQNNAVLSYLQAQNISVDAAPSGSELIVGIDIFV